MLQEYNEIVGVLDKPLIWKRTNQNLKFQLNKIKGFDKQTVMVFGELGHGKSTTLNKIVEIIAENYFEGLNHDCKFKSLQSIESITSCIESR